MAPPVPRKKLVKAHAAAVKWAENNPESIAAKKNLAYVNSRISKLGWTKPAPREPPRLVVGESAADKVPTVFKLGKPKGERKQLATALGASKRNVFGPLPVRKENERVYEQVRAWNADKSVDEMADKYGWSDTTREAYKNYEYLRTRLAETGGELTKRERQWEKNYMKTRLTLPPPNYQRFGPQMPGLSERATELRHETREKNLLRGARPTGGPGREEVKAATKALGAATKNGKLDRKTAERIMEVAGYSVSGTASGATTNLKKYLNELGRGPKAGMTAAVMQPFDIERNSEMIGRDNAQKVYAAAVKASPQSDPMRPDFKPEEGESWAHRFVNWDPVDQAVFLSGAGDLVPQLKPALENAKSLVADVAMFPQTIYETIYNEVTGKTSGAVAEMVKQMGVGWIEDIERAAPIIPSINELQAWAKGDFSEAADLRREDIKRASHMWATEPFTAALAVIPGVNVLARIPSIALIARSIAKANPDMPKARVWEISRMESFRPGYAKHVENIEGGIPERILSAKVIDPEDGSVLGAPFEASAIRQPSRTPVGRWTQRTWDKVTEPVYLKDRNGKHIGKPIIPLGPWTMQKRVASARARKREFDFERERVRALQMVAPVLSYIKKEPTRFRSAETKIARLEEHRTRLAEVFFSPQGPRDFDPVHFLRAVHEDIRALRDEGGLDLPTQKKHELDANLDKLDRQLDSVGMGVDYGDGLWAQAINVTRDAGIPEHQIRDLMFNLANVARAWAKRKPGRDPQDWLGSEEGRNLAGFVYGTPETADAPRSLYQLLYPDDPEIPEHPNNPHRRYRRELDEHQAAIDRGEIAPGTEFVSSRDPVYTTGPGEPTARGFKRTKTDVHKEARAAVEDNIDVRTGEIRPDADPKVAREVKKYLPYKGRYRKTKNKITAWVGMTSLKQKSDRMLNFAKALSDEELELFQRWYERTWDYIAYLYGDEAMEAMGNAFYASQAAQSPAGGIGTIFRIAQDIADGKPMPTGSSQWLTRNVWKLMTDEALGQNPQGLAAKLMDFIDAGAGLKMRGLMREAHLGGPGVVDRWTWRSDGFITLESDGEAPTMLLNQLPGTKVSEGLKTSKGQAIAYEYSSLRLQELTNYWNRHGMLNKRDWTIEQIQALDWFATKKEWVENGWTPESAEGGSPLDMALENTREIIFDGTLDDLQLAIDEATGMHPNFVLETVLESMGAHQLSGGYERHPGRYMIHPKSKMVVEKPGVVFPERVPPVLDADGWGRSPPRVRDVTHGDGPLGMHPPKRFTTEENYQLYKKKPVPPLDPLGNGRFQVGDERPPDYVYRAISEEEYQLARQRGYFQTDGRMNLSPDEGTVAALEDPSWYLPGGLGSSPLGTHEGRVIRIQYFDEDGWRHDRDGYVKTSERIPFERVDMVTPKLTREKFMGPKGWEETTPWVADRERQAAGIRIMSGLTRAERKAQPDPSKRVMVQQSVSPEGRLHAIVAGAPRVLDRLEQRLKAREVDGASYSIRYPGQYGGTKTQRRHQLDIRREQRGRAAEASERAGWKPNDRPNPIILGADTIRLDFGRGKAALKRAERMAEEMGIPTNQVKARLTEELGGKPEVLHQRMPISPLAPDGEIKGAIQWLDGEGGRQLVYLSERADAATFLHELIGHAAHEMKREFPADFAALEKVYGKEYPDWTRAEHERFATETERYHMTGKAPTPELEPIFARIRQWMYTIYETISALGRPIPNETKVLLDQYYGKKPMEFEPPKKLKRKGGMPDPTDPKGVLELATETIELLARDLTNDPQRRQTVAGNMKWMEEQVSWNDDFTPEVRAVIRHAFKRFREVKSGHSIFSPDEQAAIREYGRVLGVRHAEVEKSATRLAAAPNDFKIQMAKDIMETLDDPDIDLETAEKTISDLQDIAYEFDQLTARGNERQKLLSRTVSDIERALDPDRPQSTKEQRDVAIEAMRVISEEVEQIYIDVFGDGLTPAEVEAMKDGLRRRANVLTTRLREQGMVPEGTGDASFVPHKNMFEVFETKLRGAVRLPAAGRRRKDIGLEPRRTRSAFSTGKNELILYQGGDLAIDPQTLIGTYMNRLRFVETRMLRQELDSISLRITVDDYGNPRVPEGWYILNRSGKHIPERLRALQGKTDEEIGDMLAAGEDLDTHISTDEGIVEELERYKQAWLSKSEKGNVPSRWHDADIKDLRMIPADIVERMVGRVFETAPGGTVAASFGLLGTAGRFAAILAHPIGYGQANIVANTALLAITNPAGLSRALLEFSRLAPSLRATRPMLYQKIGVASGDFMAEAGIPEFYVKQQSRAERYERVAAGASQWTASKLGSQFDLPFRVASWTAWARKYGLRGPDDWERVLNSTDAKDKDLVRMISTRMREDMLDFNKLTPAEKLASRWLFIWPFVRAATAWPFHAIREYPERMGAISAAAEAQQKAYEEQPGMESVRSRYYRAAPPSERTLFDLGQVPTEGGGAINWNPVNPLGPPVEKLDELMKLASGDPKVIAGILNPVFRQGGAGIFGDRDMDWWNVAEAAVPGLSYVRAYNTPRKRGAQVYTDRDSFWDYIRRREGRFWPEQVDWDEVRSGAEKERKESDRRPSWEQSTEKDLKTFDKIWNAVKDDPSVSPDDKQKIERSITAYYALDKATSDLADELGIDEDKLSEIQRIEATERVMLEYFPKDGPGFIKDRGFIESLPKKLRGSSRSQEGYRQYLRDAIQAWRSRAWTKGRDLEIVED